jgi:hypothetical protein
VRSRVIVRARLQRTLVARPSPLHPSRNWRLLCRATPPSLAAEAAVDERERHASPTSTNRPPNVHPRGSADSRARSGVLFSAAFVRMLPRGPKSVGELSSRNALDGARRASVIALLRTSPAVPQIGSRGRRRSWWPCGYHVLFGPLGELSLALLLWPFASFPIASRPFSGRDAR